MLKYIIKRIILSILTIFVLCTVVFFAIKFIPGDPFSGPEYTEEVRQQLHELYGYDQPIIVQYINYMGNLLQGGPNMPEKMPAASLSVAARKITQPAQVRIKVRKI